MPSVLQRLSRASRFLIAALALTGALHAQTPEAVKLRETSERFQAAYDAKNWSEAIELGTQLALLEPGAPGHPYNLACVCALKGDGASALGHLETSVKLGWADVQLLGQDPDLASLRGLPGFERVLDAARANYAAVVAGFGARVDAAPPLFVFPMRSSAVEPVPLIVALHPYGSTAEWMAEWWKPVAEELGAVLVLPRAVLPFGGGFQWGEAEQANVVVERALAVLAKELEAREIQSDPKRTLLTGFSQGGYMALNLSRHRARDFTTVLAIAGRYAPEAILPAIEGVVDPYVILLVGEEDRELDSNRQADLDLAKRGVGHLLRTYPRVGHAFPPDHVGELASILREHWQLRAITPAGAEVPPAKRY